MLYKTCVWCGARIPFGKSRCEKCQKDYDKIRMESAERKADKSEVRKFRASREWQAKREAVLAKCNYLCQDCLAKGRYTVATEVHHIVPLYVDFTKRLDDDNLRPLCHDCHEVYSQEARRKWNERQRKKEELNEYLL